MAADYAKSLDDLQTLEGKLASARLNLARLQAAQRIGRIHATDSEISQAERKVSDLTAQVATAQTHHREALARDGGRLLMDVQGALDSLAGIQTVLNRIAQDLRSVTSPTGGA